jgi:hypothetical protein
LEIIRKLKAIHTHLKEGGSTSYICLHERKIPICYEELGVSLEGWRLLLELENPS